MQRINVLPRLVDRLSRQAVVYGGGLGLLMLGSLANVAIFTRLMPPSEFGKLALLVVVATTLSVLYNLGTLQGTLGLVFGKGTDEGADEDVVLAPADDEGVGERSDASAADQPEALGTGLLLTTLIAGVGTLAVWMLADGLSRALLQSPANADAIRLAAIAGAGGAVFRMLVAVPRMERRPSAWVAFSVARPVLAITIGVAFVVQGEGAKGVLAGLVIATTLLVGLALVLMRDAYRLRFRARFVPDILKLGLVFVPVALSLYVINHTGVLILSQAVTSAEIGLYAVAATLAGLIVSVASVFFMAWLPMKRTSLFVAVHQERGHGWMYSMVTTYVLLGVAAMYVVVTAGADVLVRVAGSEYSEAAKLIPILGLAGVAHAVFLLAYRIVAFPRKRVALGITTTAAALLFIGTGLILVHPLGLYGVPVAALTVFAGAALTMLALNQRGDRAIPFQYGRLARIAFACAVCVGGHTFFSKYVGAARPMLDLGTVVTYVVLLFSLGVVSRSEIRWFLRVARDGLVLQQHGRAELAASLAALSPEHVHVLERAAGPPASANTNSVSPAAVVAALRTVAFVGDPTELDDGIGRYLMSSLSRAERDALARSLWSRGVPPAELDRLEEALDELRRLPPHAWIRADHGPAPWAQTQSRSDVDGR